jgi:hypothetical protein
VASLGIRKTAGQPSIETKIGKEQFERRFLAPENPLQNNRPIHDSFSFSQWQCISNGYFF